MGISSALLGMLACKVGSLILRTWSLEVNPSSWSVLNANPNPVGATRVYRLSSGTLFAWDATGRYVWWSTDGGQTWTAHDYGTGVASSPLYGRVVVKDGSETMLMAERDTNADAVCMWATAAFPPVRTVFSVDIRGASVGQAYDGEPLICGDRATPNGGGQYAKIARYVSGAWQSVIIYNGYPNGAWAGSVCKTSDGTYVAGFSEWYRNELWVRRSTDFTTWGAEQDITAGSSPTNHYGMTPGPNGIVVNMRYGSSTTTLRYSLDHGATWAASVNPGTNYEYKTEYSALLGMFIRSSGNDIFTSPDGITWTVHTLLNAASLIADVNPVTAPPGPVPSGGSVWTKRLPVSGSLVDVLGYGLAGDPAGLLMACSGASSGANKLWASSDGGLTWAQRNPSPSASAIFFTNGRFFFDNGISPAVSTDLTAFTALTGFSALGAFMFEYIGGQYVAVDNLNNFINVSANGIAWTYYGLAPFATGTIVGGIRTPSRMLAFIENGPSGVQVWSSTDGLSWSTRGYVGGPTFYAQAGGYGNGRTIIAGYISAASPDKLYYSDDDGATWSGPVSLPFGSVGGQKKVLYKNGVWIISGEQGVCRSVDNGQTWSLINTGFAGSSWRTGAVSRNTFVVANQNSDTDGLKSSPV